MKKKTRKRRIRGGTAAAGLAALMLLSSCSLLPEEETFANTPTVKEYESVVYKTARAEVDDVVLSEKLTVYYVPLRTESLSFSVEGKSYGNFYVSEGEEVKEGDLLASADLGTLESTLESYLARAENLELSIRQNEEKRSIALRRSDEMTRGSAVSDVQKARDQVNKQYDQIAQSYQDSLYILNMRIEETRAKIDEGTIRAPFDGTVAYVYTPVSVTETTQKNRTVIKLTDSSRLLFRGNTVNWNRLDYDAEYTITVSDVSYKARAATEEALGIPETAHTEGKNGYIYFELEEPAYDLSESTSGKVEILLGKRTNVVCVPNSAISTINGETVVYYPLESGSKYFRKVETGLVGNTATEILSGVSDGEEVIVK